MVGSLTGAVSSQRVTEECEGTLGTVGHRADSAMAQACLTARLTSRAGAKAGHSDPVVLYGRAIAQRIKGTPGITGLFLPRVHIDGGVWHLDVGSSHPGAVAGPKGSAVRRLKWYASWVQNVSNTALPGSNSWKNLLAHIGETLLKFKTGFKGQYRGKAGYDVTTTLAMIW